MNVTLINYSHEPTLNVGLASIISSMKEVGHEVRLIDLVFMREDSPNENVLHQLKRNSPDTIGITTNFDVYDVSTLIQRIRQDFSSIPIILGETNNNLYPFPSDKKSEQLQNDIWRFEGDAWTFSGKANAAVLQIMASIERGDAPEKNVVSALPADFNTLPFPDYSLFDMSHYFNTSMILEGLLPIFASRGCPYSCSFCPIRESSYQHKKPALVLEEIQIQEERHGREGMHSLGFGDPTFGLSRREFIEMMNLFRRNGLQERLTWFCLTRPEIITKEWAKEAVRSGCQLVHLGLENAQESIRNGIFNKGFTNKQLRQAIRNLNHAGLRYSFLLMVGVDGTSILSDIRSILASSSYHPLETHITQYQPYSNTPLGECSFATRKTKSTGAALLEAARRSLTSAYKFGQLLGDVRRGMTLHGSAYMNEVLNYLFNRNQTRTLPLWHRLTFHLMLQRPHFNIDRERYIEENRAGRISDDK